MKAKKNTLCLFADKKGGELNRPGNHLPFLLSREHSELKQPQNATQRDCQTVGDKR
ncbi:Uncharacterised protein [Yersinia enterocolitica]|nr:Uncharacterised protein [Yersinia enterocolitica]